MEKKCFLYERCNHVDCNSSFCRRRYLMERIYNNSLLSDKQREHINLKVDADMTDLEEFKRLANICENIVDFVERGENLYIHSGTCGNGKTSWTLKMLESYANKVWPYAESGCVMLFVSVPKFILAVKENITNKNEYAQFILDNYLKADIVIWDDIATKTATQFEIDNLLRMINDRIYAGKSNVYTSNLDAAGLSAALDERLASRIRGSIDIELHGKDKRNLAVGGKY